jgi:hypothetical protein
VSDKFDRFGVFDGPVRTHQRVGSVSSEKSSITQFFIPALLEKFGNTRAILQIADRIAPPPIDSNPPVSDCAADLTRFFAARTDVVTSELAHHEARGKSNETREEELGFVASTYR